jgi:hypothetical protein
MTTRNGILALAFLLAGGGAANAAVDNVVLIAVGKVALPTKLPGLCNLSGTISQVWQGSTFDPGEKISLKVPCSGGESRLIPAMAVLGGPDSAQFVAVDVLQKSKLGFARIDDSGALIWQNSSKRSYGPWGSAWGYRVLDGAAVPAAPDRADP